MSCVLKRKSHWGYLCGEIIALLRFLSLSLFVLNTGNTNTIDVLVSLHPHMHTQITALRKVRSLSHKAKPRTVNRQFQLSKICTPNRHNGKVVGYFQELGKG